MIYDKEIALQTAGMLLQIKAIKLNPANPFTWASGWKSPIYCDNRKILSYPKYRTFVFDQMAKLISQEYGSPDVIAGVATAGIPIGTLVAHALGLPFVYVRSSAKDHGLENQIEGVLESGQSVVVIEDLVSTGGSSLKAVDAVRNAGARVMGMAAIFSYGFPAAEENFKKNNCFLYTLSDYEHMLKKAVEEEYIREEEVDLLSKWRKSPDTWGV